MGLRYRKSINLGGGLRINVSKSGVSYSWGMPGYRITKLANGKIRKTYSIPKTGISYVEEQKQSNKLTAGEMQNIESGEINNFKSAELKDLINKIERTIEINTFSNILFLSVFLVYFHPAFLSLILIPCIIKIINRIKAVNLEYKFHDDEEEKYNSIVNAWSTLSQCNKFWQEIQTAEVYDKRYHAGAGRLVNRKNCSIDNQKPYYIKTNVSLIRIHLKDRTLMILPDKVFIIQGSDIGCINYSDINLLISDTRFIETGFVPSDARIIDYTWQYVNKNGTKDKRFSNNRQLPICRYGKITIASDSGLYIILQCSSENITNNFKSKINEFEKIIIA